MSARGHITGGYCNDCQQLACPVCKNDCHCDGYPCPKEQERTRLRLDDQQLVTRIEVIDEYGRCFSRWNTSIELSYQDQGRTLKIFVAPSKSSRKEQT